MNGDNLIEYRDGVEWCGEKNCGARLPGHSPTCKYATVEEKDANIKFMNEVYQKKSSAMEILRVKLCDQITFWQGKFRIVIHENNVLRKKFEMLREENKRLKADLDMSRNSESINEVFKEMGS